MSSKQLWSAFQNGDLSSFVSVASTALVFYEYAITIDSERQQIWSREVSVATVLFILTRYITLLDRLLVVIPNFTSSSLEACNLGTWLQAITASLLMVVMSAIAAVRIFALWNRDWRWFAVIMIPGLFPAFTNLYFRSASAVLLVPSSLFACQTVPTAMSAITYKNLSIDARVVSMFGDGMVVMLTWLKTYRVFVLTKGVASRISVSTIILRDGTLYFFAICVLNGVAIIYIVHTGSNLLSDIIVALSSILMSRFLLNLRRHPVRRAEWQSATATPEGDMSSHSFPKLVFPSSPSDSMGRSMIGDSDAVPHDSTDSMWDIELVEVRKAPASDRDSGSYDPLASASTVATAPRIRPFYPGNRDAVEGRGCGVN